MRTATLVALLALSGLVACAARDTWPVEWIDPDSAVHFTILAEPWVFARESPMLAANARDYLNVGVVMASRSGSRTYWLGVVAWSTIDRGLSEDAVGPMNAIRLNWPSSGLDLTAAAGGRNAVGLGKPAFVDPASEYAEKWYPLSPDQLMRLAAEPPGTIALLDPTGEQFLFGAWRVDREAMAEFVRSTGL